MEDQTNFLLSLIWESFLKIRLIVMLIPFLLFLAFYGLIIASITHYSYYIENWGAISFSFSNYLNEMILISLLVAISAFFISYVCSTNEVNSKISSVIIPIFVVLAPMIIAIIIFPFSEWTEILYSFFGLALLCTLSLFWTSWLYLLYRTYTGLITINKSEQFPDLLNNSQDRHEALLVVNYEGIKTPVFGQGCELVIKKFIDNRTPYKVYICQTQKEIIECICNNSAISLWIFAHGKYDAIKSSNNQFLYYHKINLSNVSKKEFVGQFHCNGISPGCKESLADLIGLEGYVTRDLRDITRNEVEIKTILQIRKNSF